MLCSAAVCVKGSQAMKYPVQQALAMTEIATIIISITWVNGMLQRLPS
jgi:hypothetical protein